MTAKKMRARTTRTKRNLLKLDKFDEEDLEDKSDAYIEARFDVEIENLEDQKNEPVGDNLLKTANETENGHEKKMDELYEKRANLYEGNGGD